MSSRFSSPPSGPLGLSRTTVIAGSVILFHVAALWALQSGLIRRAAEVVVPVEILAQIIAPPRPAPPPPPPVPPPPAPPKKETPRPPPKPRAIRERVPTPAPNAPVGQIEPPPPAPVVVVEAPPAPPAPPAPAPAPPAPPAPPAMIEVTQGQTQYVREPRIVYPAMSRRLGETGTVIIDVYYDAQGMARRAEISKSSGYERLDQAARTAALGSQVTPFRLGGNAQTVYRLRAPFNFVLN